METKPAIVEGPARRLNNWSAQQAPHVTSTESMLRDAAFWALNDHVVRQDRGEYLHPYLSVCSGIEAASGALDAVTYDDDW